MRIGILGTGVVGEAIATALIEKGHEVRMGSRAAGNEKAVAWAKKAGKLATEGSFNDAAIYGDLVFLCLNGEFALDAIDSIDPSGLNGKILIDVTNPLDFTQGMPPRILEEYRHVSLGERIQQAVPNAYVVKTLNTINYSVMVNPKKVNNGKHSLFVCGNHMDAKNKVKHFLADAFGWDAESFVDLGDIKAARCSEAFVPLWVMLWQAVGSPLFSVKLVQ
jgi:8-hydroxy-5-deazaflavin:NADPH oxidoreductase